VYSNLKGTNKIIETWTIVFNVLYSKVVFKLEEFVFQAN